MANQNFAKSHYDFHYFFVRLSSTIYPLHEKFSSDRAKIFQKVFKDKKTNSRKIWGSNVKKLQKNRLWSNYDVMVRQNAKNGPAEARFGETLIDRNFAVFIMKSSLTTH